MIKGESREERILCSFLSTSARCNGTDFTAIDSPEVELVAIETVANEPRPSMPPRRHFWISIFERGGERERIIVGFSLCLSFLFLYL